MNRVVWYLRGDDFQTTMSGFTFTQAQADMRDGYFNGAPGVLVSGVVWLIAGVVAVMAQPRIAVWALLAGGMVIHPLSLAVGKLLGRRGAHAADNPLGVLAGEGTVWLLAGIAVAFVVSVLRLDWFFPAMLLTIGGRYLTFQTLYGLRLYWALGGALGLLGVAMAMAQVPPPLSLFAGGAVELVFAGLLFTRASR